MSFHLKGGTQVARKSAIQEESKHLERVISFRAPDTFHGALKQIVGRLELLLRFWKSKTPASKPGLRCVQVVALRQS